MSFQRVTRSLICCLAFAACTGTSTHHEPEQQSSVVGMTGGTVELSSGSSVSIPAGALPDNTTITATEAPETPAPTDSTVVGTPVVFGPEGQQFTQPVTVTLAFDPSKLPPGTDPSHIVIFTAPVGSTSYTSLGGTLADATHVQAITTHFSVFIPGVSSSSDQCAVCAGGRCASTCPTGSANCSGTCQDTQSDPGNCGACGHACGQNEGCFQGACVASCGARVNSGCSADPNGSCCQGFTMCSGKCADLQADSQNCGACGTSCGQSEQCTAGSCQPICAGGGTCFHGLCAPNCPSGSAMCNGQCVETQHDPANCGACGHACGQNEGCFQGACVPSCGPKTESGCASHGTDGTVTCCEGFTACGQACFDLQNDHQNCGACGTTCGNDQVCRAGVCGPVCANGATCFQGLCITGCPSGSTACGGNCVNTADDSANCGACGQACGEGKACYQGVCVSACGNTNPSRDGGTDVGPDGGGHSGQCQADADCGTGAMCKNGLCVPAGEDGGMAHGCQESGCPSGQFCSPDGLCRPGDADGGLPCPAEFQCDGRCVNLISDTNNCGACHHTCGQGETCQNRICTAGGAFDGGAHMSCASDVDCGAGFVCQAGVCKPAGTGCQATPCAGGFICMPDGSCQPPASDGGLPCPAQNQCGGQCVNINSDRNNCGSCAHACGPTQSCQARVCVEANDGGTPGVCTSNADCGAGSVCLAGICKPGGADGGVDGGSPTTCNFNSECADGQVCYRNTCVLGQPADGGVGCPGGAQVCADACVDLNHDINNCGSCMNICPNGNVCNAGLCQAGGANDGGAGPMCTMDSMCPSGWSCIASFCSPP